MSLQNEFSLVGHSVSVGQLIKPNEPNDLETLSIGEDISIGRFVKKVVDVNGYEKIFAMAFNDTAVYGISVNDNPTAMQVGTVGTVHSVARGDVVLVGRISSKLTIRPELMIQDGTTDTLNAGLYVICGGADSGKLLAAKTAPTPSATTSYIALSNSVYRLRMTSDTNEVYLEVTPGMGGGAPSYTLPTASATVMGGVKIGTTLSIDANSVLNVAPTK
jgi:hypothetical protein